VQQRNGTIELGLELGGARDREVHVADVGQVDGVMAVVVLRKGGRGACEDEQRDNRAPGSHAMPQVMAGSGGREGRDNIRPRGSGVNRAAREGRSSPRVN
jgi:hypothetical protein